MPIHSNTDVCCSPRQRRSSATKYCADEDTVGASSSSQDEPLKDSPAPVPESEPGRDRAGLLRRHQFIEVSFGSMEVDAVLGAQISTQRRQAAHSEKATPSTNADCAAGMDGARGSKQRSHKQSYHGTRYHQRAPVTVTEDSIEYLDYMERL